MKRHLSRIIFCCFLPALLAGCASLPASRTTEEIASPNFDQRKPNYVILHHTGSDNADRALRTLTSAESRVSAHYLIDRDGKTIQLVEESARAWHAGKSYWGGNTDMNSVSVGIELDNNGSEPFAEAQIEALLILLADLKQRHNIPAANFIGHADVAPARKEDPSAFFPWDVLAQNGFGLWCENPTSDVPQGFDLTLTLAALGYDPGIPDESVLAFRLHYLRGDLIVALEQENAIAFCLWQKKSAESLRDRP